MDPQQTQTIISLIDDLQQTAFEAADAVIQAQNVDYQYEAGDMVQGGSSGGTWYGIILDRTADGEFSDRILDGDGEQADQTIQGTEDNPAYLIQVMQEGEDGWVPGEARPAHRQDSIETWDVDESDIAEMPEMNVSASGSFSCHLEASDTLSAADTDGLAGIVWASGTHSLWVNGEPTKVTVPEDTIQDTFSRLQDRISAGNPPKIGFDHPEEDSVAAQTVLGEIGVAEEFTQDRLNDGREAITMRESEFTNSKAVEAAEAGSFDDMGFSIVGNISLQTGDDGQPVRADDGSLLVEATEIHRVDVVPDQAVKGAKNGNLPELAAASKAAGELAARSPGVQSEAFVQTLQAAAGSIEADSGTTDGFQSQMTDGDLPTDPDSLEAAKSALQQASEAVEAKDEQIEELEAEVSSLSDEAEHFREIAASQGVDPDADEFDPQDVVDAFSEDLRAEIAELEASLPKHSVEDQEERIEGLAGKSLSELEAMAGQRWREYGRSQQKKSDLSAAVAADETVGSVESASGSGGQSDEKAESVLTARELVEAKQHGQSPSEFVKAEYGVNPSEFGTEAELQAAISGGD